MQQKKINWYNNIPTSNVRMNKSINLLTYEK